MCNKAMPHVRFDGTDFLANISEAFAQLANVANAYEPQG